MEYKRFSKEIKKAVITKILAAFLYHRALLYRNASKIFGMVKPVLYKLVQYWYKQWKDLFVVGCKRTTSNRDRWNQRKTRGNTGLSLDCCQCCQLGIVAIYLSITRCGLSPYCFLKKVPLSCTNKLVIIDDKTSWYPWASQRLGLRSKHETFCERSAGEQWHLPFRHRIKRFSKRYLFHNIKTSIERWCLCYVIYGKKGRFLFWQWPKN